MREHLIRIMKEAPDVTQAGSPADKAIFAVSWFLSVGMDKEDPVYAEFKDWLLGKKLN